VYIDKQLYLHPESQAVRDAWNLCNTVSMGLIPPEPIIHFYSLSHGVLSLSRTVGRFTRDLDSMYYPVNDHLALGRLLFTSGTLLILAEQGWPELKEIIPRAVPEKKLRLEGNDVLDENDVKYAGMTELTNGHGLVTSAIIQCFTETDINALLASDEHKKREVGMLPIFIDEMVTRIEELM
jgi:hypothetical protein